MHANTHLHPQSSHTEHRLSLLRSQTRSGRLRLRRRSPPGACPSICQAPTGRALVLMLTRAGRSQGNSPAQCDEGGGRALLPAPPRVEPQGPLFLPASCTISRVQPKGPTEEQSPNSRACCRIACGPLPRKQSQSWGDRVGCGVQQPSCGLHGCCVGLPVSGGWATSSLPPGRLTPLWGRSMAATVFQLRGSSWSLFGVRPGPSCYPTHGVTRPRPAPSAPAPPLAP